MLASSHYASLRQAAGETELIDRLEAGAMDSFDNASGRVWLLGHTWAWALALLVLIPLQDSARPNPQAEYAQVHQLLLRGYLELSQREAQQEAWRFHRYSPAWARQFEQLEAEAMVWRGMFKDALGILGSLSPGADDPQGRIEKLTLEGIALMRLRQLPQANERLANAESVCAGGAYAACGGVLRARGILLLAQGDLGKAREVSLACLDFARTHGDRWLESTALQNLGAVSLREEHYDEAVDWSKSAYRTAVQLGAEDLAQRSSGNLGWAYFKLGDAERALNLFLDAEDRAKRLGDVRHEIYWLTTAGSVYRDYGTLSQAETTFREALALATQLNSSDDIADILEDISHVSVEIGHLDAARGYLDRVNPLVQKSGNGLDIAYVNLAQGKLAAALHRDAEAEALFLTVEKDPASQISMRFAAEHELAKLLEGEGKAAAAEAMYRKALATFESAREGLKDDSKLPFLANAKSIYDDYIHFLVGHGKADAALLIADQSRARTLAQGLGEASSMKPPTLPPQVVAQRAGATLLFYWMGAKQSYLWAITPDKTTLFPLAAEGELTAHIERYRKALVGPEDPAEASDPDGLALYAKLVAPAAALLAAHRDRPVMILSDGALSELNFETLLVGEAGKAPHYWIEDATVESAPSLAMLSAGLATGLPASANGLSGKLLLMGDAIAPSGEYASLPYAGEEVERIEKHFRAADRAAFTRERATPAAYLGSNPRQFAYMHFVSHGVASRTDPLDSAIILSRPLSSNVPAEDSFKLYAWEIMRHPIDARLVTISACYGSGRAYAGEGLVGLSWAFLRAGAHNTIGALWEASDESTPQLMDAFYAGLQAGQSPAAALRQAKLELLHSRSVFRKPLYWAPFQMYTRM